MTVGQLSNVGLARAGQPGTRRVVILTEDSKPALGGIAEYLHQLALATSAIRDVLIVTSVPGAEALNPGLPFKYRETSWFRTQDPRPGDHIAPVRLVNSAVWRATRRDRVKGLLAAIHQQDPQSAYVIGRLSPVTFPWCEACFDLGLEYSAIGYGLELIEPLSRHEAQRRTAFALHASHWFAISHDTRDKLMDLGVSAAQQSLLMPGVAALATPTATFEERRSIRGRLGIGERPFVFSLSYLRHRKGVDLAIEAFANIAADFPDLIYVIGGSGPEAPSLSALARARGMADRIVFVGTIDDATKGALFADCELFMLPTRVEPYDVEGFGIVFLEAGLYGKAVIGGSGGGVPDAIEHGVTGLLVDTRDAGDLTTALRQLIGDPALAGAMGQRGRERAERGFAWPDRGRAFVAQIDALGRRASRHTEPKSNEPLVRLRRGAGRASNRLLAGTYVLRNLALQGRLLAYLADRPAPADVEACTRETLAWLTRAFAVGEGGAPAGYHPADGWAGAYPEITGYMIPTLLHYGRTLSQPALIELAQRAGAWLAGTRLAGGAICRKQWFPGNTVPSVFNTAQVIEGWCALARTGIPPLDGGTPWFSLARESGDWLLREQEPDGSWVRNALNGTRHSYYARVASPLARLGCNTDDARFNAGARLGLDWVISRQTATGWFQDAGFTVGESPTTHTIGYVIEGLLQAGLLLGESRYVEAAERAAWPLLLEYERRGWLAGRFSAGWRPRAQWRCLTGDAQVAITWCLLGRVNGEARYRRAAARTADAIRRSVRITKAWPEISGGVQGSSPPWGDYDPYGYPTHAAKFTLDLFALLAAS